MGLFGSDKQEPQSPHRVEPPAASRPQPGPGGTPSGRSVLSKACKVEGTVTSSDDLAVEGEIIGTVGTSGHLMITVSGSLKADVHGRNVTIAGTVKGNVTADERIELEPSAKVAGNITAPRILIKDGATFEGQVFMKSPHKAPGPTVAQQGAEPAPKPSAPEANNRHGRGNR